MDTKQLDENVDLLTRETTHRIDTDAGNKYVKAASLLDQLREAVESSMKGGGGLARKNTLPLNADALDLLNDIKATATEYWSLFTQTHTVHGTLEDRIQSWAANTRSHREDAAETAERITGQWITRIQAMFDPPKRQQVKAACPACEAKYRYTQESGETVRQAALQVTVLEGGQSYAECGVCLTRWERGQMHLLAQVVEAS